MPHLLRVRPRPTRALTANPIRSDLGVHDVKKALALRISDEDETRFVERVRIVRAQLVVECSRSFFERHAMLFQVRGCLPRIPSKPHAH
jgi:hypothetical protein